MSVAASTASAIKTEVTERRSLGWGVFFLVVAAAIIFFFGRNTEAEMMTKFNLNPGFKSDAIRLEPLIVPSQMTLWVLSAVVALIGGWQLARGFKNVHLALLVVALTFIFAFLTWAARGTSMSLFGMLSASMTAAAPIALGGLSGVLCERVGVINIAIEGMMLSAAMTSVIVSSVFRSRGMEEPWYLVLGLLAAILTGAVLAAFHAWLSVRFKVDQIVSGAVIIIFSAGVTSFISQRFLQPIPELNSSDFFRRFPIPVVSKIPFIGPLLFENNLIIYLVILLVIVIHIGLFYTRWGLRSIAVGEHPRAADTLGVNVFKMRYLNVILGGMVAGIGGAYFTIGSVGRFDELITNGKGFIGLAAMIFGRWTPIGTFFASLIFGFADSLQVKLQGLGIDQVPIPSEFMLMAPYIVTMVVVAGVVGRSIPPAADGQPYEKQ
ncbi:MAG: ABC transporter permease [Anaerolineae bacterium]